MMNGWMRVKGQLPGDKAVINRGTGKGQRGGQENTESSHNFGLPEIGGDKHA